MQKYMGFILKTNNIKDICVLTTSDCKGAYHGIRYWHRSEGGNALLYNLKTKQLLYIWEDEHTMYPDSQELSEFIEAWLNHG